MPIPTGGANPWRIVLRECFWVVNAFGPVRPARACVMARRPYLADRPPSGRSVRPRGGAVGDGRGVSLPLSVYEASVVSPFEFAWAWKGATREIITGLARWRYVSRAYATVRSARVSASDSTRPSCRPTRGG